MCKYCGQKTDGFDWVIAFESGTKRLCPICLARLGATLVGVIAEKDAFPIDFVLKGNSICEINKTQDAIYMINELDNESYSLNADTFTRLITHNLKPEEWKYLTSHHHSKHDFMLHDDFYSFETGYALQPIR